MRGEVSDAVPPRGVAADERHNLEEKCLQWRAREFFASHFTESTDEFIFHGGRVSREALARIKRALPGAARECADNH